MNSMKFPDKFKTEIRQNLNELARKSARLIKDKKL